MEANLYYGSSNNIKAYDTNGIVNSPFFFTSLVASDARASKNPFASAFFIPLAARILRVADTFAALTDRRPYNNAPLSAPDAKIYLTEQAGIEFDPKVVKMFLLLEDLEELESYSDGYELE